MKSHGLSIVSLVPGKVSPKHRRKEAYIINMITKRKDVIKMLVLGNERDKRKIQGYPVEIQDELALKLCILEGYGAKRNIFVDPGGYIILVSSKNDFERVNDALGMDIESDATPEYVDTMSSGKEVSFISAVFFLRDDFVVDLIIPLDLVPAHLKSYIPK